MVSNWTWANAALINMGNVTDSSFKNSSRSPMVSMSFSGEGRLRFQKIISQIMTTVFLLFGTIIRLLFGYTCTGIVMCPAKWSSFHRGVPMPRWRDLITDTVLPYQSEVLVVMA